MKVHLFTNIAGFPYGTAPTNRIMNVGKSFLAANVEFEIYTCFFKNNKYNNKISGVYEGIKYKYLYNKTSIRGIFRKAIFFFVSVLRSFIFISRMNKKKDIVYIYAQGNVFNLIILIFCSIFRISVIQEVNEWFHREKNMKLRTFLTEGPLLKWSDGVIAISKRIEENSKNINPKLSSIVIPVLIDEFSLQNIEHPNESFGKYCFWMGLVDGYDFDLKFIIKGFASLRNKYDYLNLMISGPYSEQKKDELLDIARSHRISPERIRFVGYVEEKLLNFYIANALFFIVPMWNNERSKSRFPTKVASFMLSGKPLITAPIGSVGELLTNRHNVLFYKSGESDDLAKKIEELVSNTELYNNICENSIVYANKTFIYRNYSVDLKEFAKKILIK